MQKYLFIIKCLSFIPVNKEKEARDAKNAGKRSFVGNKPAPYVKLKTNKVYGNCPIYTVDPEVLLFSFGS